MRGSNNYQVSAFYKGEWFTRTYFEYTKREAIARFRDTFGLKGKHIDLKVVPVGAWI